MRFAIAVVLAATLSYGAATTLAAPAGRDLARRDAMPTAAPAYRIERLVAGSAFQTINGIALDPGGALYAASVAGESVYVVAPDGRSVRTLVGPPRGESDDLVVTSDGALIWTAMLEGAVRRRDRNGTIRDIATGIPGVNPIAFDRARTRLFVGQMLFGDGLWEVDPAGHRPARRIVAGVGSLNAFAFGADGYLYAPRYLDGTIVRIDPATGDLKTIATGFKHVVSVRVAADGTILALDGGTGELVALNGEERRVIARLPSSDDNMVIGRDGELFVSNMADGSIVRVDPRDGHVTPMIKAALAFPRAIAVANGALYVADTYALRRVDTRTGAVSDVLRPVESEIRPPAGVSAADGGRIVSTCEMLGLVQLIDPAAAKVVQTFTGLDHPLDAVRIADGRILVVEPGKGDLVELAGDARRVVASGLRAPVAIAANGPKSVYVAESAAGTVTSIDLASGRHTTVASGLGAPRAVVAMPGGIAVLDVAGRRVVLVDRRTRRTRVIARDLPVGHLMTPYPRSGGLAADPDGTLYVAADAENAIYKIRR